MDTPAPSAVLSRSDTLEAISGLLGWSYFFCWSLSFYPQVWINYKRKTVAGLSLDYQLLNILGYSCYSIYCSLLLWDKAVTRQYDRNFDSNLVTPQDAFFAIHGACITLVTIAQCFIYDRGGQVPARWSVVAASSAAVITLLYALLITATGGLSSPTMAGDVGVVSWLGWVYWLSLVKLGVTVSKYVPQAILNYRRKSTTGWSIGNVILDFSGGSLSVAQLLLDGATLGWSGVVGDPIKFCLGFTSMFFDVLFLIQHYVLYTDRTDNETRTSAIAQSVQGAGTTVSLIGESYSGPPSMLLRGDGMADGLLSKSATQNPSYFERGTDASFFNSSTW